MKRSIYLLLAIAFVPTVFVSNFYACSCGPRPALTTQLTRDWTKTIVTGRIVSVDRIREEQREYDHGAYRSATLIVDKVFEGNVKVGERLVLAQGSGSDCSFTWTEKSVGGDWLFYLGEPSKGHQYWVEEAEELKTDDTLMYGTSYCGRSAPLEAAARDLAFLNDRAKLTGKTRVSGDLEFGDRSVEGIDVRLTGKGVNLRTKYLKSGFFEFYDVPPGEYVVEIIPPRGWVVNAHWMGSWGIGQEFADEALKKLRKNQKLIRVTKGEHTDLDLTLAPDTKISGRVLSPTGSPMAKVCVTAQQVTPDKDGSGGRACTDEKGEFSMSTMSPGNYLLIANSEGKIDAEQPFSKLYYPGVRTEQNAGVIAVDPGRYNENIEFQIPELNRLVEISGRVLYADDMPVEDIWVSFKPTSEDRFSSESTRTDKDGRFVLKVPFGAVGIVYGGKYFSKYSHPDCATILDRAEESGSELKTDGLEVDGTRSIANSVIRFPFDFCKEKDR